MEENQPLAFVIKIQRDFLKWIYSHRLVDNIDRNSAFYQKMMANAPDEEEIPFGGAYGAQFNSADEIRSFILAFNSLLNKHKIPTIHRSPLLYAIIFLGDDYEKQHEKNIQTNRLIEYTRFILDLYQTGKSHFDSMAKNPAYQMIYHEGMKEYFFAKKELFETLTLEQIAEDRPNEKPGDIVQYLRVRIFDSEMYVPNELLFSITSSQTLRAFQGEVIPKIKIPAYLQSELFKFTIRYMLDEHKRNNTKFYQAIFRSGLTSEDFKTLYNQYKKHGVSQPESLLRVGVIVSDYLKLHKLLKNKSDEAAFLFEYFSLFKAMKIKKPVTFPTDYNEMPQFYIRNGINKNTIRLMMKDADKVGEI